MDVFWFEEPIAPDDYRGHGKLAEATAIPIATGENEYTRYGFRDLIAADSPRRYSMRMHRFSVALRNS